MTVFRFHQAVTDLGHLVTRLGVIFQIVFQLFAWLLAQNFLIFFIINLIQWEYCTILLYWLSHRPSRLLETYKWLVYWISILLLFLKHLTNAKSVINIYQLPWNPHWWYPIIPSMYGFNLQIIILDKMYKAGKSVIPL